MITLRRLAALTTAALGASLLVIVPPSEDAQVAQAVKGVSNGTKAVAHYAGQKVIRKGSVTKKAPSGQARYVGMDAIEPTIGAAKDGDLFYVATGSSLGPSILRSKDMGKKWVDVSPKAGPANRHPVTLDPYVYIDERTQRVYTIDLTVACSYLSFSDDDGANWVTNPLACGTPVNDHQTLFSGPGKTTPATPAYDGVLYYCYSAVVGTTNCTKSIDGGVTFAQTGEPVYSAYRPREGEPSDGRCTGFNGHGAVDADGTVFLPKDACEEPYLFRSDDEGLTWEGVKVSKTALPYGPDPAVTVDKKGNVYYAWTGPAGKLFMAVSKNNGKSFGPTMDITAPKVVGTEMPTIDAIAPGKVAVGYMGTTNSKDNKKGMPDRDYSKATWNGYITTTTNALARKPVFYSATVNKPSDPIYRGSCNIATDRCRPNLDFMDIQISPKDGRPYAAFVDACVLACAAADGVANDGGAGFVGTLIGGPKLR
jgi:hypothetical protein